MKSIQRFIDTPVLVIFLGLLAFGIQSLWLGYYLDDWVFLYHIYRGGYDQLSAYSFGVNRPFGAWPWWVGFSIFGYSPVLWQLWSLAWRMITVLLLWIGWKQIFPNKKLEISLASTLFLVYPVFVQQTAAVTFSDHWMCFALYALSILLMVYSIKNRRLYILFTAMGLASSALQLFTIEYFVGLEFIRPLLLWYLFSDSAGFMPRIKKVAWYELPYAVVFAIFLVWRFVFMPTPGFDRNKPELLSGFLREPIQTLSTFSVKALQDVVEAVMGAWYKTYNPATIALTPVSTLISWGIVVVAFLASALFFLYRRNHDREPAAGKKQAFEWVAISFIVMIAGFLPAWVVQQQLVSGGNYADRFGLAAMFGTSLFVVSLAGYLVRQKPKILILCLLIALATGYHFRLSNEFRWKWERQSRLAWQLSWRIPGLAQDTAVYGDGVIESGSWADIAWLNFIYSAPLEKPTDDYWYYNLDKYQPAELPLPGQSLSEQRFEHLFFEGNSSDSIVIQFKSIDHQCLWVVTQQDQDNPYLDPLVKEALPLSNPLRIRSSNGTNPAMKMIFLPEPDHEWCYYFEKAQLAIQEKQWDQVRTLWQELSAQGLKTGVAIEYLPFVYGAAKSGDFETALAISTRAKSLDIFMQDPICKTWRQILEEPSQAEDRSQIRLEVIDQLDCGYLIQ